MRVNQYASKQRKRTIVLFGTINATDSVEIKGNTNSFAPTNCFFLLCCELRLAFDMSVDLIGNEFSIRFAKKVSGKVYLFSPFFFATFLWNIASG